MESIRPKTRTPRGGKAPTTCGRGTNSGESSETDRDLAASIYGATPGGNFEGTNVLHLAQPLNDLANGLGLELSELEARKATIDERLACIPRHADPARSG